MSKYTGNVSPYDTNYGYVPKDRFSVDGRSVSWRDPYNPHLIDEESGINPNSLEMTNALYQYSPGAIEDAGDYLGIGNVDEKKEVKQILAYLKEPKAFASDLDALEQSSKKDKKQNRKDPTDYAPQQDYEVSPELNEVIDRNKAFEEKRLAGTIFQPLRFQPSDDEILVQELADTANQEETNRENQFLFDYITDMELA